MEVSNDKPKKRPPVSGLSPLPKKAYPLPTSASHRASNSEISSRLRKLSFPLRDQNSQQSSSPQSIQGEGEVEEKRVERLPWKDLRIDEIIGSSAVFDVTLKCSLVDACSNLCLSDSTSDFLIRLQGFWSQSLLEIGAKIKIFGYFNKADEVEEIVLSDRSDNFLLVYPDVLVQCTTIAQGLYCRRKTILNERFKGLEGSNRAMLIGILAHSLFQDLLKHSNTTKTANVEWLKSRLKFYLEDRSILDHLFDLEIKAEALQEDLQPYVQQILSWIRSFYLGKQPLSKGSDTVAIGVRDIEENIWCPKYGIRGRVDVTLQVGHRGSKLGNRTQLLPLELKTGRTSKGADHQGQVILYNLMLSSLKDADPVSKGYLLYLKDGTGHLVESSQQALRGILQLRNELAFYLADPSGLSSKDYTDRKLLLPEPLNDSRTCSKCPQLLNCAMWQKVPESQLYDEFPMDHSMRSLVPQALAHLSRAHMDYFWSWVRWIEMESEAAQKQRSKVSNVWLVASEIRQAGGEGLANLRIVDVSPGDGKAEAEMPTSFIVTFGGSAMASSVLSAGEVAVVSSTTRNHYAIMMGVVTAVDKDSVSLRTDKAPSDAVRGDTFRLDKYQSKSTFQTNFSNCSRLMDDSPAAGKLRELIIDRATPKFVSNLPSGIVKRIKPFISKSLNRAQVKAITKVFRAEDYVLVRGLPGSGKTKTIAAIINCLSSLGHSVLLTSYTHSAVDNCLIKLVTEHSDSGVSDKILRLGACHSIHADCLGFSLDQRMEEEIRKGGEGVDRLGVLTRLLSHSPIVACTALQASTHSVFGKRSFDYVIVDEATLALQSVLIGPLLVAAKAFVLVGDSCQLSPLVVSKEAKLAGMDESLFSRLESGHEEAVVTLNCQYRMNREIASLSNRLFYNGSLECANQSVADATIHSEVSDQSTFDREYFRRPLSPKIEDSVTLIATPEEDKEFSTLSDGPGQIFNRGEARVIRDICVGFIKTRKLEPECIGIICIYKRQIQLIREELESVLSREECQKVEVRTADQYQGRDKPVILVSFVWTASKDDPEKMSDLLGDLKRINVVLTRAKHKLVLVGRQSSFERHSVLANLISILRKEQIVQM